jgi:hypothetical protein
MKISQNWIHSRGVVTRMHPCGPLFRGTVILINKVDSIKPWHTDKIDIIYLVIWQALQTCMKSNWLR